jgi:phenylacetate-CoA ligase
MSELNGPGVAFECEKNGMHLWEEQYLLKVVDPQTGEESELVATILVREGMPISR